MITMFIFALQDYSQSITLDWAENVYRWVKILHYCMGYIIHVYQIDFS